MGTIKFNGLYFYSGGRLWLRFEAGNKVAGRYIEGVSVPGIAASLISQGQAGYGFGTYTLDGEAIDIQLAFPSGPRKFIGTVGDDVINLQFVATGKQNPTRPYVFLKLEEDALLASQAELVWRARQKLATGAAAKANMEAAASIGDFISTLALRPMFDVEDVSSRFVALGVPACLRLLFALSWSDDGEWYTPKQGVTKGGSRKEDEGKLLRTLAKWCLKPDEKLVAKAKEQFREIVKVGPAYLFLDATMKMFLADNATDRVAAMNAALSLYLAQDVYAASEPARSKVVPWLLGEGDHLAAMLKNIQ